jgi:hypothetical protein
MPRCSRPPYWRPCESTRTAPTSSSASGTRQRAAEGSPRPCQYVRPTRGRATHRRGRCALGSRVEQNRCRRPMPAKR